jgi:sulfite oxidase
MADCSDPKIAWIPCTFHSRRDCCPPYNPGAARLGDFDSANPDSADGLHRMNDRKEMKTAASNARTTEATLSRREWLRRSTATAVVTAGGIPARALVHGAAIEDEPGLIVRSRRPLDLETSVEAFDDWLTPNRLFFVRSHLGEPTVELDTWKLEVSGMVEQPLALSVGDLATMEVVTRPSVLQCSGNGRAFFKPTMPGVPWERGAVGNASWSGVRLADILKRAGARLDAGHVHLLGADLPPTPKTPSYLRSIPIARALDPTTLVATLMNGERLPWEHGGPMRLVVPGWTGNHWMKWLMRIVVEADEAPGFYQQTGYRIARTPAPPGADLKPGDLVPLTTLNVKSLISWPRPEARLRRGRVELRGVAWTGAGFVERVDVAIGEAGAWQPAQLLGEPRAGTWRQWRLPWTADRSGRYVIRARATDSQGQVQPSSPPWNRSGYLWNGIDSVSCEIV